MKRLIKFLLCLIYIGAKASEILMISPEEIQEILASAELYAYFGSAVSSISDDLIVINHDMAKHYASNTHVQQLCDYISQGKTTAPVSIIQAALEEAAYYLYDLRELDDNEIRRLREVVEQYYEHFSHGIFDIHHPNENENIPTRGDKTKTRCSVDVKGKLLAGCLGVRNNACVNGNVNVNGNEIVHGTLTLLNTPAASVGDFFLTINSNGLVTKSTVVVPSDGFIINGCQPGPLSIGTSDSTTLTLVTQCTDRLSINANGAVTIQTPEAGEVGLTIVGGGETITAGDLNIVAGNIILPSATAGAATSASNGLIEFGGANPSATNVSEFKVGTRNFFEGNYAIVPNVSGTDNIAFGTNANSTLTTGNNTIAIGNAAIATATDSISIGDTANSTVGRTIVIGSRDSTSTGVAPTATALNAIAIGSASGTQAGSSATGIAAIAIGGSGGTNAGTSAAGTRSIALGVNASSVAANTIAIGASSGNVGGIGANAGMVSAIAIGSANGTVAGASTSAVAGLGAIAIGGADGVFTGATAGGNRAIGIGVRPTANADASICIGSASGVAGGVGPSAVERTSIGIGSAQGTQRAPNPGNTSAIAIGGADGVFPGAVALGMRSIAIGQNATTVGTGALGAITIGSSSGVVGGTAPTASGATSIAIGSASANIAGANATSAASIAIGGSDGITPGARATAARTISIGNGANCVTADRVLLGNAASTAVRVGIGIAAPVAKLDVIGANGTIIFRINQVNTGIANAPTWQNPSTSAVAGTPIHYNGANQLFGFTSSARYKTNIRPIKDESSIIYQLRSVLYDSKEEYGDGKNIAGFIAEEVYKVAPYMVIMNDKNEPENIAYNALHAFAIKEIQKHKTELDRQDVCLERNQQILHTLYNSFNTLKKRLQL